MGVDPDPANNPRLMAWARDYWSALHPLSAGGGYVNMMMDEGEDNVKAAYRDHHPRLAVIKKAVDPENRDAPVKPGVRRIWPCSGRELGPTGPNKAQT